MAFYSIKPRPQSLDVSVVVPVRDEALNIFPLGVQIGHAMTSIGGSWECIWVDDGSSDGSADEMIRLHNTDPRHTHIKLDGAPGQSAAFAAGLSNARGRLIVTIDGDGQNDPADIPRLVAMLSTENADMIQGWREDRQIGLKRRISSRAANAYRNKLTRENIRDVGCSLRVFRRECVDGMIAFNGMHRFFPTMVRLNGFSRIIEAPVRDRPRRYGRTKYGIRDRLGVGIGDTFAVRWMASRLIYPRLKLGTDENAANRRHLPEGCSDV
ncbi:MAG: glycosyltransferase family 2 protein [bacterium]